MTAAHAHTAPRHAAAAKARRLPTIPRRTEKVIGARAQRVTPTGRALYSVDSTGSADRNLIQVTRDGFATFALDTGTVLASSSQGHWLVQLFETEEQRRARVNVQAVAAVLNILGAIVRR